MREDGIVQQLHRAQDIITGYKTRQRIAGDSWRVYRAQSDRTWDIELNGTMMTAPWTKRWKVTYQIEGGRKIPNAFCVWYNKTLNGIEVDYFGSVSIQIMGFNTAFELDGKDPLVGYFLITTANNWDNTVNSFVKAKFRAVSPYKGTIKFEEIAE